MKFFAVLIIALSVLGLSCNKQKNNVVNNRALYSVKLKKSHKEYLMNFNSLFTDPKLIPLQLNDSSLIASVSKVIVSNSKYYILDKNFSQVYSFDKGGKELNKYGSIGLGTGQYKKISDFDILDNQLAILSNDDQAIFFYDVSNGKFIKRLNIDLFGYSLTLVPDKSILIYVNQNSNDKSKDNNVIRIDSSGDVIEKYFPYNSQTSSMTITFSGFLKKIDSAVYYSSPFTNVVYQYKEGKFETYIDWGINDNYVEANNQKFDNIYKESVIRDPYTSFLQDVFLKNNKFLICSYQDSIHVNYCYYNIAHNHLQIYKKDVIADPELLLVGRPQFLNEANEITFSITPDYIYYLKTSLPELYSQLAPDQRRILDKMDKKSNPLLMTCKFK